MDDLSKHHVNKVWTICVTIFDKVVEAAKLYGLECRDLDDPSIEALSKFLNAELAPTIERIISSGLLEHDGNIKIIDVGHGIFLIKQMVKAMEADNEAEFARYLKELDNLSLFPIG